jgi:hypothetical protein
MRTIHYFSVVALATLLFASCETNETDLLLGDQAKSTQLVEGTFSPIFTTTVDELTQADINGLMQMFEEEKMAHDVYANFFEIFKDSIFYRISISEQRHQEAVLALIVHFGLSVPESSEVGVFSNSEIQNLYTQLISAGVSLEAALETGAYIEEYDIADLQGLLAETRNADLIKVYTNLLKGSENHLRAFVASLSSYGLTYEPGILSATVYAEILSAANNKGNRNGVMGHNGKGKAGTQKQGTGNANPVDANGDGLCDNTGEPISLEQGKGTNQNGMKGNTNGGNRKGGK